MKLRPASIKIIIAYLIGLSIGFYQYNKDRQKHLRLERKGIVVNANSSFHPLSDAEYVKFSFITNNNKKVERFEKCGSKEIFQQQYETMLVIYNPDDPEDFQNLYDFSNYSVYYKAFFFLLLIPCVYLFFILIIIKGIKHFIHLKKEKVSSNAKV